MSDPRPINIAILAMGGEGGGVLADWLINVAEQGDYLVQSTSVPGVAQRTGATIYYLEIFPAEMARVRGKAPVLGLVPMPGDIDLVVASELMEAGRAVQRGLVTADRTVLLTSTHRVYSMTEKTAATDGRVDAEALLAACQKAAKRCVGFDMAAQAESAKSVISAVLLGAIAGSGALPFPRELFEQAIRAGGISVAASLAAFEAGFANAGNGGVAPVAKVQPANSTGNWYSKQMPATLKSDVRDLILAGIQRTEDYQDRRYAELYLQRLAPFLELANSNDEAQKLVGEGARQLALAMTFEDTIRVAELKLRATRFERVRTEVNSSREQIVEIAEFMHPRVEEIADTLPAFLGRWLMASATTRRVVGRFTKRGRVMRTTSLRGFLPLYMIASRKRHRRKTLRYVRETQFIEAWLATVREAATRDLALAVSIVELRNLVKGYGETHERGLAKYHRIRAFIDGRPGTTGAEVMTLVDAAQSEEEEHALNAALSKRRGKKLEAGVAAGSIYAQS